MLKFLSTWLFDCSSCSLNAMSAGETPLAAADPARTTKIADFSRASSRFFQTHLLLLSKTNFYCLFFRFQFFCRQISSATAACLTLCGDLRLQTRPSNHWLQPLDTCQLLPCSKCRILIPFLFKKCCFLL